MVHRVVVPLTAVALLGAACGSARSSSPGSALALCTGCHGDAAQGNAAPPRSVNGLTATSELAVGAHQRHLAGGHVRGPVACQECHRVPATVDEQGHMGKGVADVVFGSLATARGSAASWDRTSATCATYCHGASLAGGQVTRPVWTRLDGAQLACDSCHGAPPPAPHPQGASCSSCHPDTVKPDGTIDLAGGKHIDGVVEVGGVGCTSCHGDASRASNPAAPPRGTRGETATTDRAVGAHQQHLQPGALRAAVACSECHVVPNDLSHVTGTVELAFGPLATAGGAAPAWNGSSCASTYCHGATLNAGGTLTTPTWTQVDGTQAACGTCHGAPPPTSTGHPPAAADLTGCGGCHPATVKPDGTIDVAGGKHIDGQVEVQGGACNSCHGSSANDAPPRGPHGETATTDPAVGAHQAHVTSGALASAFDCGVCHVVPASTANHPSGTVNVTFGGVADTGTASSWNAAGNTCATYCHGATLQGGTRTQPTWTQVDGTQAACGTCHGVAPATGQHGRSEHVNAGCGACHPGYTSSSVNVANHVNGKLDTGNELQSYDPATGNCVGCHGSANWLHGD